MLPAVSYAMLPGCLNAVWRRLQAFEMFASGLCHGVRVCGREPNCSLGIPAVHAAPIRNAANRALKGCHIYEPL